MNRTNNIFCCFDQENRRFFLLFCANDVHTLYKVWLVNWPDPVFLAQETSRFNVIEYIVKFNIQQWFVHGRV